MKLTSVFLLLLISLFDASFARAEPPNDWVPDGISTLGRNASSKSEFTFDHSMLVLVSKLDPNNEDLRRVIAGVNGIAVRTYRFVAPAQYKQPALTAVNEEYRAAGWKELIHKNDKGEGPGMTGLWVRLENNAISNVAILLARSDEVKFVVISGSISPLDISHLGGHFGIPKLEGGVLVPNTERRP